ncbi:hypothetical protein BT96DRAFT_455260 [Gymnopus androsaceus JB14]|uniref:Uncharacterized protein n=1 Tax=Gymnopus androsaceus JB14 TaxID=1447944 RepID=A0A6A4GR52_9AGAR|nr:hypothetical protein BT96DRAFT_455260 [Gymnopus androsaceus JB14]
MAPILARWCRLAFLRLRDSEVRTCFYALLHKTRIHRLEILDLLHILLSTLKTEAYEPIHHNHFVAYPRIDKSTTLSLRGTVNFLISSFH